MIAQSDDRLKLDAGLAQLLDRPYIRLDQTVPVIISAEPGRLGAVSAIVEGYRGQVRHVLEQLDALVVWLPLSAVQEIAHLAFITDIELDQDLHIA